MILERLQLRARTVILYGNLGLAALLESLPTEQARERASVFMTGLAEMRNKLKKLDIPHRERTVPSLGLHQVFFEDPSRITSDSPLSLGAPVDFTVTRSALPPGWSRVRSGHWYVVSPDGAFLPEQGWKIHVSATMETADATCRAVWDHCTEHGLTFKHLLNRNLLVAANTKYAPRASSGKLLTIYTRDEDELERTLRGLSARIGGGPGPRVLSDLRWEEGPLYVRYGAFQEMWCPGGHGAPVPALRHPDGTLVPDRRLPVFSPPSWVTLPSFLKPHADTASGGERQPYVLIVGGGPAGSAAVKNQVR